MGRTRFAKVGAIAFAFITVFVLCVSEAAALAPQDNNVAVAYSTDETDDVYDEAICGHVHDLTSSTKAAPEAICMHTEADGLTFLRVTQVIYRPYNGVDPNVRRTKHWTEYYRLYYCSICKMETTRVLTELENHTGTSSCSLCGWRA